MPAEHRFITMQQLMQAAGTNCQLCFLWTVPTVAIWQGTFSGIILYFRKTPNTLNAVKHKIVAQT